jgi:hypothetical protein
MIRPGIEVPNLNEHVINKYKKISVCQDVIMGRLLIEKA